MSKKTNDEAFSNYKNLFDDEDKRIAHSITMMVSVCIAVLYLFYPKKFLSLFYDPDKPLLYNIVQFAIVLLICFLFGFFNSVLVTYVRRFFRTIVGKLLNTTNRKKKKN